MAQSQRYTYPDGLDSDDTGSAYSGTSTSRRGAKYSTPPPSYHSGYANVDAYNAGTGHLCVVCNSRLRYSRGGKTYPTCGLTCNAQLQAEMMAMAYSGSNTGWQFNQSRHALPTCVVCKTKSVRGGYVTCSTTCIEKLWKDGGDPTMCDYCHARPRVAGKNQCGQTCADKAKVACLLCKSRPTNRTFQLCGKTCKSISTKETPLLLEAPKGHKTFTMVESLFQKAWKNGGTAPTISKVYKIIENDDFRRPYDVYLKAVGNEQFRYHGTKRQCQLGTSTTTLCTSGSCAICSILKTSFKVSLAGHGCFGRGIYSSSASNKAHGYMGGSGVMILTKVVVGKAHPGGTSCPAGYDSVVYDDGGPANETIVYRDDAIRPVFLIIF